MSDDLIKRWRRIARDYDLAITASMIAELPTLSERELGDAEGRRQALLDCAASLERSLARKRAKERK